MSGAMSVSETIICAVNDSSPVRTTAPVGKPLTVPLNPKPLRAPRAWAAATDASGRAEAEYDGLAGAVEESLHATAARAATASIPAVIVFIAILLIVDDDGAGLRQGLRLAVDEVVHHDEVLGAARADIGDRRVQRGLAAGDQHPG